MRQEMLLSSIQIGSRHRKAHGDIDALADSIRQVGLLHPIVVRPDGTLIAGARRIEAFKKLDRESIPVTVIDLAKVVRGEYAENYFRKAFTPTEAVEIEDALREFEDAEAKKRQKEGGRTGGATAGRSRPTNRGRQNLPKPKQGPRAADKIAKAAGKSRETMKKARAVVEAAKAEPEKFAAVQEAMDESGNVDRAFKQVQIAQARADYEARADQGSKVGDLVSMAESGQRFSVIYADPPWEFKVYSGKGKQRSAERYYDTASLDALKKLPVQALAAQDCALFMWCVSPELPGALALLEAWGFEYKTVGFAWAKENESGVGWFMGMGYWTRANVELCLFATRGSPLRLAMDVRQLVVAPIGAHSEKPEEVRERIERLLAGPYLELFARRPVKGWTIWGNEIEAESGNDGPTFMEGAA